MNIHPLYYCFVGCSILIVSACSGDKTNAPSPSTQQTEVPKDSAATLTAQMMDTVIPTPTDYTVLQSAIGDLDKDNLPEKVIVYDTKRNAEMGTERELRMFKIENNHWKLWHTSVGPVLSSLHGGTMGDPFLSVAISKGCIVIDHYGGSRDRWAYTHRYRFQQNDWYLIGATVNYGTPCEQWEEFDFNLSTGKVAYKKETEACDDNGSKRVTESQTEKKIFQHPVKLPQMDDFYPGDHEVSIPGREYGFYY